MRCALIIPSWTPEEIFPAKTAGSQLNYWQPLGTLYVASSLRRAGHEVRFFNGAFLPHQKLLDEVVAFAPQWAGVYSTTFGWPGACRTAQDLRQRLPQAFLCAGGPYPIGAKDLGPFDALVTGEGERTVVEMLQRLDRLECVPGVIHRGGVNPPRPLVEHLDELPFPDRSLLGDANRYLPPPAMYRRKPVAVMLTSRGCKRKCIFCFQLDKERKTGVRYRSVENVLDEIELCLSQGFREIKFIDDTFAQDRERALAIARGIRQRKLDFTWFASACVNQVDAELLREFRAAGCWAMLFGVESGVAKNLKTIRKGITPGQVRDAVRWAKAAGIRVHLSFVFGIPGETYDEALQTIDFACELDPDMASFHALVPFPGTWLYDHAAELGTVSEDLRDFTYQGAAFVPRTMTREQIRDLRQLAFRKFYSRPSVLLRKVLALRDARTAFHSARSFFWLWAGRGVMKVQNG